MYMYIWLCNVPLRIYSKNKNVVFCVIYVASHFSHVKRNTGGGGVILYLV